MLVVTALVGGVALLRQRPADSRAREAGAPVQTREPSPRTPSGTPDWLGVLIAEESMDLASRMDGRVESVKVQVGSVVQQGDVLVKMDARSLQEDLAISESGLLSMKAELDAARLAQTQAEERLRRRETPEQLRLMAISEEELSTARYEQRMGLAKLEVARARVREHEVRVAQLRQKVTEASVRAPFDGVVSGRFVHPTAMVRAGEPLVHLMRRGKLQVRFAKPAQEPGVLTAGQSVRVELAEQGLIFEGRVTQVAPEVDVSTRMVFALADLERTDAIPALAGTAVRVKPMDEKSRAESH